MNRTDVFIARRCTSAAPATVEIMWSSTRRLQLVKSAENADKSPIYEYIRKKRIREEKKKGRRKWTKWEKKLI